MRDNDDRPTPAQRARVALEAGVSVRTADRAYSGEDMRMSTLRALIDAAQRLGIPAPPVNLGLGAHRSG